jgi:NADH-quinone oxidoreductase subunit H
MVFLTLLLPIFLLNSTFNIIDIVIFQTNYNNFLLFLPSAIYFFIILLAETNRVPFDLPEAEAELVAGYNVEYSAINFAMFFLAEYTNMLVNSAIYVSFFLGGWVSSIDNLFFFHDFLYNILIFNIKTVFVACIFIVVRAILPRYRFDQLMNLC